MFVFFIAGVATIRKLEKYNIALCVHLVNENKEMRELLELATQKIDKLTTEMEKSNKANFSEKLCISYYLPFNTDEEVDEFMRPDADLHRRKLGLREVKKKN